MRPGDAGQSSNDACNSDARLLCLFAGGEDCLRDSAYDSLRLAVNLGGKRGSRKNGLRRPGRSSVDRRSASRCAGPFGERAHAITARVPSGRAVPSAARCSDVNSRQVWNVRQVLNAGRSIWRNAQGKTLKNSGLASPLTTESSGSVSRPAGPGFAPPPITKVLVSTCTQKACPPCDPDAELHVRSYVTELVETCASIADRVTRTTWKRGHPAGGVLVSGQGQVTGSPR